MNRQMLWGLALVVIATGVGVGIWWLLLPKTPTEPLEYTVVLESNVTPEAAKETPLYRVVLHISSGTGLEAVKRYLNATQTAGAVYEFITPVGRFLAIGPAFSGQIERIPQTLKDAMAPWANVRKITTVGLYTIYEGELRPTPSP